MTALQVPPASKWGHASSSSNVTAVPTAGATTETGMRRSTSQTGLSTAAAPPATPLPFERILKSSGDEFREFAGFLGHKHTSKELVMMCH